LVAIADAVADISAGFARYPLWSYMAVRELKLRYARSFIGPFWVTLTMAAWVIGMSLVSGGLFGASLRDSMPYVTLGIVAWTFLATVLNESASCVVAAKHILLQSRMPVTTFVWLVLFRNLIVAGHNMAIFAVLVVAFGLWPNMNWLWLLAGLPPLLLAALGMSLLVAVITPRYRDLAPLIGSLTTIGFLLSPVMWRPDNMVRFRFIYDYNPFAHLIAIFREPLLGRVPPIESLEAAGATAAVTLLLGFLALAGVRRRLTYWL
jgi:ABC-type polysaccharide/polyol phosphate export permease